MQNGQFKVTITHNAVSTDYITNRFPTIKVTGRENGVSSAVLLADNLDSGLYPDNVDALDTIQIYVKEAGVAAWTKLFDGVIRHCNPSLDKQSLVELKCKGLGVALENTNCNTNFGYTSNNDGLDTIEAIIEDLVDNYVNKSFGSANNTGYAIGKDYVQAIDAALKIPFINSPYNSCKQIIDNICMLDTAYRAGATAGPHYFVDVSGNLRIKTIGTQQAHGGFGGGDWGTYYGGSAAVVTLTEREDFSSYKITKATDEYANSIVLATDLRKPPYDYLTEDSGGAALWGNDAFSSITDVNGAGPPIEFVVGSHGLEFDPNGAVQGYGYYPATADAGWDVEKWGSEENPPKVNFYYLKYLLTTAATYIFLSDNSTARKTDYFYATFSDWYTDPDDEWIHVSLPIGPYYRTNLENKRFRWAQFGTPAWSNIDSIEFATAGAGADGRLLIDDLHFSGKIIREAVDTSEVTTYNEYQKIIMSRNALDDSAVALDDSGMAGQYAYAELLRRVNLPRTMRCRVPLQKDLKPGEYYSINAGYNGVGYEINAVDFRTTEYIHNIDGDGFNTDLVLTDDVKNSFPVSKLDMRGFLDEFMLVNNEEAKNMKSNGVVDLLIPHLRKPY